MFYIEVKKVEQAMVCIMPFWKKGMTVEKVAKDMGVATRTISSLRRGTFKGDWATLVNCARYFNVSVNDLIQVVEETEDTEK